MRQLPIDSLTNVLTSHAMLIPWGIFAQRIGLISALEEVLIPQRQREHRPQTKLIEFLVAILLGCAYLQDISRSPHPLDQDQAVAQAWGQEKWADYSGVSRTLKASTDETVTSVQDALAKVSRSFIEREVVLALRDRDVLILDGDLTERPVSSSSTTYPDVTFGWMSDAIQLGYQAALVSMHSPTYGRLWLSVEQHPGDTVSSSEAEALVHAAEARTGARPWRRTDLLMERIEQHQPLVEKTETKQHRALSRLSDCQESLDQVHRERQAWAQEVSDLEIAYQARNRPERPYSRLAKARRKLDVRERRLVRRQRDLEKAQTWLSRCQQKVAALHAERASLQERLARFIEDNRTNPWPIRVIFRLDGGFGTGSNVALLIEMGYEVYSKASNYQTARALRQRTGSRPWLQVGKNAEMIAWEDAELRHCPYPLDLALERFQTGEKLKHAVLLHYGPKPVTTDLEGWFHSTMDVRRLKQVSRRARTSSKCTI